MLPLLLLAFLACAPERAEPDARPAESEEGSATADPDRWLVHEAGALRHWVLTRHTLPDEESRTAPRTLREAIREPGRAGPVRRVHLQSAGASERFEHRPGAILRQLEGAWLPLLDAELLNAEGTLRSEHASWRITRDVAEVDPPAGFAGPCRLLTWVGERMEDEPGASPAEVWARLSRIEERWTLCEDVGEVARHTVLTTRADQRAVVARSLRSPPPP